MTGSPSPFGRHRRRFMAALATLAAACLAAFAAPVAQAGVYTVDACANPDTGLPVATPGGGLPDGFSVDQPRGRYTYASHCGTSAGVQMVQDYQPAATVSDPASGALRFTAPANTSVAQYAVWRAFQRISGGDGFRATLFRHAVASGYQVEWRHCYWQSDCEIGDFANHFSTANRVDVGIPTSGFKLELVGDGVTDGAIVHMFAARIVLSDSDNPLFRTDPTGSLATETVLRGSVAAGFDVSDLGGGIHDVAVLVGDDVAASSTVTTGECDAAARTRTVPCPLALDRTVTLNTAQLPDGSYPVRLRAQDVAGNQRLFSLGTKTVDNVPPPTNLTVPAVIGVARHGAGLATDAGTWNGAGLVHSYQWQRLSAGGWEDIPGAATRSYTVADGDVGKRLRSRVTASNSDGTATAYSLSTEPIPAPSAPAQPGTDSVVVIPGRDGGSGNDGRSGNNGQGGTSGPAGPGGADGAPGGVTPNGQNASTRASLLARFARTTRDKLSIRYGKPIPVIGTILSPSGQPVVGARIDVQVRTGLLGAAFVPAGTAVSNVRGEFRYLAPKGFSRVVRFGYKAYLEDTAFAQTSDVTVTVTPKLSFKASSASVRNLKSVKFTGKVTAAPARSRRIVEIQALDGRRWRTIATARMKNGAFSYRYRFTRTRRVSVYKFRARVRQETGWPYGTGQSRPVKVKVRP